MSTISTLGSNERWLAPVAVIDAPDGFGEESWTEAQPESILAWTLGGSEVRCEIDGFRNRRILPGEPRVHLRARGAPTRSRSARLRFGHFYVEDGLLRRVAEGLDLSGFTSASLRHDLIMFEDPALHGLLNIYAARAFDRSQPPSRMEAEARAILVAERLISAHHLGRLAMKQRGGLASWQLRRACAAMDAQLDGEIGLAALARIAGCSPTHFSRAFKQSMGRPPFAWLLERRIGRAKELLSDRRLPLAQVALAVGFAAQPQFTTAFKRATGMAPGAWRRERLS